MKTKLLLLLLTGLPLFLAQAQTPAGIRFDYQNTKPAEVTESGEKSSFRAKKHKGLVLLIDTLSRSAVYYSVKDQHAGQYGFENFSRLFSYYTTKNEELAEAVTGSSMIVQKWYESDTLVFEKGLLRMGSLFVVTENRSEKAFKHPTPEILKIEYFEETKEIMGYRCQKAKVYTQTTLRLKTLKLVKYKRKEYTVWFTEKFQNPFIEFAGLKGMALEYTDEEKTYTAVRQSVYTGETGFKNLFPKAPVRFVSESDRIEREKKVSADPKVRKEKYLALGYEEVEE